VVKIIYCNSLKDIPGYPLMQMFRDAPGWEARVMKDTRLDPRTVYKFRQEYWVPFTKEWQPEGSEIDDNAN